MQVGCDPAWITSTGELAPAEPIVVYGGEGNREGTRRAIGWRQLADEPWVSPSPSLGLSQNSRIIY